MTPPNGAEQQLNTIDQRVRDCEEHDRDRNPEHIGRK
jgi:hypothetical protein